MIGIGQLGSELFIRGGVPQRDGDGNCIFNFRGKLLIFRRELRQKNMTTGIPLGGIFRAAAGKQKSAQTKRG